MVRARVWPILALLLVLSGAGVYALKLLTAPAVPDRAVAAPKLAPLAPRTPSPLPESSPPLAAGALRYLAIGGGAVPESTEVSLEQNLALVRAVLAGPGSLLFAGGVGSLSVRELSTPEQRDELLVRLGDLFAPRSGRGSRYRESAIAAGEASLDAVEAELVSALAHGERPLLLYFAVHGERAEHPRDNSVVLWGGRRLSAARLAELHEAHPRPLRVVSAACFSGGFGELAFSFAEVERGPARVPRCGLFAGTWDRETSGCDPDPDRRRQEGYSLHFWNALAGRDRDARPLGRSELDLDQDGRVSLLEAHTRAAIVARSLDVPTTTSERYLREVQRTPAQRSAGTLVEYSALVSRLQARLHLIGAAEADRRAAALEAALRALDEELTDAEDALGERFAALSARLLGRWPVLDDAFHPDFARTLAADRRAIIEALDGWPEAKAFWAAQAAFDQLDARYQAAELEEAPVQRLLRARETLELAAALERRGGPKWAHYRTLLNCERFVPDVAASDLAPAPGLRR